MKKTVLITGSSRGIGRATALLFAKEGYQVAINYHSSGRQAQELEQELKAMGADVLCLCADVSVRTQVDEMVQRTIKTFGGIDVLVNNAGIARQKLFTDLTEEEWDHMFDVNVKGVFHCCQSVLPEMIRKKAGKIINISSIWGLVGASCEVDYSAAKAAVIGLTKALAKEVGPSNIQVNCVAPGVIETDMIADFTQDDIAALKDQIPLGRIGKTQDVASTVVFLASDAANFMTGQVISPNGGFVI